MTNPTIYSGSERILRAGVFCTLLDLTLTEKILENIKIYGNVSKAVIE
jgi:hypothetical protein